MVSVRLTCAIICMPELPLSNSRLSPLLYRFQCGDSRVQEHQLYGVGRRRSGQDQTTVATLLPEHTRLFSPYHPPLSLVHSLSVHLVRVHSILRHVRVVSLVRAVAGQRNFFCSVCVCVLLTLYVYRRSCLFVQSV